MNEVALEILLYVYDTLDVGLTFQARKRILGLDYFMRGWRKFNQKQIEEAFRELNRYKFIKKQEYEGSVLVSLSEKGILRARSAKLRHLKFETEKWDGKWRMVSFDIPEQCRKGRRALVYRLKSAEFYEMQKSLFLCPYDCQKEVMAIVKLFKLEKYVRFGILESFDNEENVNKLFKLEKL